MSKQQVFYGSTKIQGAGSQLATTKSSNNLKQFLPYMGGYSADNLTMKRVDLSQFGKLNLNPVEERPSPFQFSRGPELTQADRIAKAHFKEQDRREYDQIRFENIGFSPPGSRYEPKPKEPVKTFLGLKLMDSKGTDTNDTITNEDTGRQVKIIGQTTKGKQKMADVVEKFTTKSPTTGQKKLVLPEAPKKVPGTSKVVKRGKDSAYSGSIPDQPKFK